MVKVKILTQCEFCDGEAYIQDGEAVSMNGEKYAHYRPCFRCHGSGKQEKWVNLDDFLDMLTAAAQDPMEPDWHALANSRPTSQYRDSRDAAGI